MRVRRFLLLLIWFFPAFSFASPPSVAVLYFQNEGNAELTPLKVGLAQMLITDLQGEPGVKIVERGQLQAILDELELGHSGTVDPATAVRLGKLIGAEYVVMGGYFEVASTFVVNGRLVSVETSEIVAAHSVKGSVVGLLQLEAELAEQFRADLRALQGEQGAALRLQRAEDVADVVAPDADALGAAIAYSEGLIFLDRDDAPRARESFQKALAAHPELEDARLQLAAMEL